MSVQCFSRFILRLHKGYMLSADLSGRDVFVLRGVHVFKVRSQRYPLRVDKGNVRFSNLAHQYLYSRECIVCPPGHFCNGCDVPLRCPSGSVNPHLGMAKESDCIKCSNGFSPSADSTQCCYNANLCSEEPDGPNFLVTWDSRMSNQESGKIFRAWFLLVLLLSYGILLLNLQ